MGVQGLIGHDLDQLHHATIFVDENMAVDHVLTGEIHKARPHPEPAWDGFRAGAPRAGGISLELRRTRRHFIGILTLAGDVELRSCRYSKSVPPDVWRLGLLRQTWLEGRWVIRINVTRISLGGGRLAVGFE